MHELTLTVGENKRHRARGKKERNNLVKLHALTLTVGEKGDCTP